MDTDDARCEDRRYREEDEGADAPDEEEPPQNARIITSLYEKKHRPADEPRGHDALDDLSDEDRSHAVVHLKDTSLNARKEREHGDERSDSDRDREGALAPMRDRERDADCHNEHDGRHDEAQEDQRTECLSFIFRTAEFAHGNGVEARICQNAEKLQIPICRVVRAGKLAREAHGDQFHGDDAEQRHNRLAGDLPEGRGGDVAGIHARIVAEIREILDTVLVDQYNAPEHMGVSFSHLVSASDITRQDADFLIKRALEMEDEMRRGRLSRRIDSHRNAFRQKCIASLFYEPSTRTRFSFERAVKTLGGDIMTADGFQFSSLYKGESVADNTKVIAGYDMDAIIMRHPDDGSAAEAAAALDEYRKETGIHVPFINAGDGKNEHPTQALLDVLTIQKECGSLINQHVALAGDLQNGRTVHSLAKLLSLYPGTRLTLASPKQLPMPEHIKDMLDERGVPFEEVHSLEEVLDAEPSALYMTRVQKERFKGKRQLAQYEKLKYSFMLNASMLKGRDTIIMHPLPRLQELSTDVDRLPNAAYMRQARNGLPMRRALMYELMNIGRQEGEDKVEYERRRAA